VTADVANLGLVRPPVVYLVSIGLGVLVHLFWPVPVLPASISMLIGVLLVLAAVALFMSSVRTFRKAGTPVPGNLPTTIIVRTGRCAPLASGYSPRSSAVQPLPTTMSWRPPCPSGNKSLVRPRHFLAFATNAIDDSSRY